MTQQRALPFPVKLAAAVVLVLAAAGGGLTLLLRVTLSPDRIRSLAIAAAQKALKREVRIGSVSVGVLKGLVLDDLEVSEAPDFNAGRFAEIRSFQFHIELLPLLRREVVARNILIDGFHANILKTRAGAFNFSDLTGSASSEPSAAPAAAFPFSLDVKKAVLSGSGLDYQDDQTGDRWSVKDLKGRALDASLDKPFAAELSARAERAGGLQASVAFKGELDARGKASIESLSLSAPGVKVKAAGTVEKAGEVITAAFSRISGEVYGNTLDLSGSFKADAKDLSGSLKGRLEEAPMTAALSVRDYAKAPEMKFDAALGAFDAGGLMAARRSQAAPAAQASPASGPALKAKGTLAVAKLVYSGAVANNLSASWDVHGVTPDLARLGGWAKLHVAGGSFKESETPRSGLVRALLLPLTLLKTIGSAIGSLAGLDFSHILFSEIAGDYAFSDGLMTIRDFHMNSAAANVSTKGTVDLPRQKLALAATIMVAKVAPIDVDVGGTFEKPTTSLRLVKTLTEPVKKLTQPGLKLLKQIFKPK